jgi:hypothetical protein
MVGRYIRPPRIWRIMRIGRDHRIRPSLAKIRIDPQFVDRIAAC